MQTDKKRAHSKAVAHSQATVSMAGQRINNVNLRVAQEEKTGKPGKVGIITRGT